jgi:predicted GNAT family acetyltransferase
MENEDTVAEMTYELQDKNTMVINHTEVDKLLRGKNIGFELVKKGVDFARREGLKIVPVCKFAKLVFDRKEVLRDVLQ